MSQNQHGSSGSGSQRVLVVEDNFLVGMLMTGMIRKLGYEPIGPVPSVEEGLRRAGNDEIVGGVLDVNIRGGTSEPIAEVLESRGIPFFFVTGYASPLLISTRLKGTPRLTKPVNEDELKKTITVRFAGE